LTNFRLDAACLFPAEPLPGGVVAHQLQRRRLMNADKDRTEFSTRSLMHKILRVTDWRGAATIAESRGNGRFWRPCAT